MNTNVTRTSAFIFAAICFTATAAMSQTLPVKFFNERFVIRDMDRLHQAQVTYAATTGKGTFGSLTQLRGAGLIDDAMAGGLKYGYVFAVTVQKDGYRATALPSLYRKTGLRSYYIDEMGILLGNDRQGNPVDRSDGVYIDICAMFGIADNERCTIGAMQTLFAAELTYAATVGNGQYAYPFILYKAGLVDVMLGIGAKHGYVFTVIFGPSTFAIFGNPDRYGETGVRSFYIDQTGILRGSDRNGGNSGPDDPPINKH